jgi:conserved oligomeric Golgi complex subunit 8
VLIIKPFADFNTQTAHQHLIKTIEVTRVNLFNIVTQYKALFDDDFSKESNTKMNLIFNSWMHEKIDDFLRMLESDLAHCNSSLMDISSILGQCMYFGVSFSRIGVDFRAQLAPIFLKTITKYLNVSVIKATKQFEMDMEHFTLINKDVSSYKRHTNEPTEDNANSPPESLLDFQPLAVYCNALLNIFNELRVCSPIAIVNPFVLALEVSLENIAKSILSFYRHEQQAFGMKEKENFLKMCSCFSFELVPYIQHCINLIFPPNNKLVHNMESLTSLRNEKILDPIEHLLPDKFATTKI